jgi:hypothetical protein
MKHSNFFMLSYPVLSLIALALNGCEAKKNPQQEIVGEWNARWETYLAEDMPEMSSENLMMNGVIDFKADGKAEISAFGYQGCIFFDDTLKNTIGWKMDDAVLRFIDSDDDNGLAYRINEFSDDEMKLTLLEDINLTLKRNN